jgi:hypothetical protein
MRWNCYQQNHIVKIVRMRKIWLLVKTHIPKSSKPKLHLRDYKYWFKGIGQNWGLVLLHFQVQFLSSGHQILPNEMLFMFKIALCAMRIIIAMTYVWHHVITHTYHPWCLAVHCTSSLKCKVKGCEQKFESDW